MFLLIMKLNINSIFFYKQCIVIFNGFSSSVCVCLFTSQVSIYEGDKRDCRKFCTTGIDGAMTIWDFKVNK